VEQEVNMAEKVSYPQIPNTVWWGVRKLLQRSPNAVVNERTLGVDLQVQEAAARQYLAELKRVGILSEDNKATPVANKWRHDDTYAEAVQEILLYAYPQDLVQLAPPGLADRQKVTSWFTREGLGVGTAGNKAATYLMINSTTPNESPSRGGNPSPKNSIREPKSAQQARPASACRPPTPSTPEQGRRPGQIDPIPLNINVEIHISADASGEQIETIFSAMRRYLYDGSAA
jgi:hypothetical protein